MDYQKSRKALPKTLVVFRDGVSEGEYTQLEKSEIQEIDSKFQPSTLKFYSMIQLMLRLQELLVEVRTRFNHTTQLVFIVVGKRYAAGTMGLLFNRAHRLDVGIMSVSFQAVQSEIMLYLAGRSTCS